MEVQFYLVVNKSGTVKTYKNKPGLNWDEISMRMNLTLPDALFQKPLLEATVIIPESAAMPQTIDAEVAANARDAIEMATGLEVQLKIVSEEGS